MPPGLRVPTSKVRTDDTVDNDRWHVPSLPAEERLLLNGKDDLANKLAVR
jgi:hypothetical protein